MRPEAYFLLAALVVVLAVIYIFKPELFKGSLSSHTKKNKKKSQFLDLYAEDLTEKVKGKDVDVVIGRDKEIQRLTQIISRRSKNNAILLGQPGVGKTAVVEGLAQRIVKGDVPESILNKRILSLDLPNLVAGTKYRGEFEKRLKTFIDEVIASDRNIIVFIDEIHILAEQQGSEGAVDASDILKPALSRGQLQAIGATTDEEYEQYFKKDVALARRFQPLDVAEPDVGYCYKILKGLKHLYEDHHHVVIKDEALQSACLLSDALIEDRFLPDKAIDVIDESSARMKLALVESKKDDGVVKKSSHNDHEKMHSGVKKVEEGVREGDSFGEKGELPEVDTDEIKQTIADWLNVSIDEIRADRKAEEL